MRFKDVVLSDGASTEAKLAALAVLLDKKVVELAETVLNVKKIEGPKGEQGLQGPKGEQGDRGFDGTNGKDGRDGKDGKDGADGPAGVGVSDAHIDFDGSLVIVLTDGREINAGEVVPLDVAEKIKVIGNGGGTSQSVLDAIEAINATIATYGTMALQNANSVAITGGNINGTTIGGTTSAAGTFTTLSTGTLTATGQTSLGGVAGSEGLRVLKTTSSVNWIQAAGGSTTTPVLLSAQGSDTDIGFRVSSFGAAAVRVFTNNAAQEQFRVSHTASAVNYVQVTGAATGSGPTISAQGSDTNVALNIASKAAQNINFRTGASSLAQFTVVHNGATIVNQSTASGSATGFAPIFGVQGSDTNISQVFQSKGTGAIDLAAGSSGVNISNGGTVTALTRAATGSGYTSFPSVAITAPTTAGSVQATASAQLVAGAAAVAGGGTGYTNGDTLTVSGGSSSFAITVTGVTGGVITSATTSSVALTSIPSNPVSVTGGTGTGATFNITYGIAGTFTITNAGSGYVEQPTVSFSGGGGSGAAAYATVGSAVILKTLHRQMSVYTAGGESTRITDLGGLNDSYVTLSGSQYQRAYVGADGSATNIGLQIGGTKGTGSIFLTTGTSGTEQLRVSHTASAVNYVQVTGGTTGGQPYITAQGSDTTVGLSIASKGTSFIYLRNAGTTVQFSAGGTSTAVNYLNARGNAAGTGPALEAVGTDTNIDLALTPKGTGRVKFGTYTANMALTVQGYIEILDSGGTVRKLAVIA